MREAFLKQNYHVRVILISIKFVVYYCILSIMRCCYYTLYGPSTLTVIIMQCGFLIAN